MDQLTSTQLSEWEAYNRLEPIGRYRDDYRTALLCAVVANITRKKGTKLATIDDFMLNWDTEQPKKRKQSLSEMKTILLTIKQHYNRKQSRKKP